MNVPDPRSNSQAYPVVFAIANHAWVSEASAAAGFKFHRAKKRSL